MLQQRTAIIRLLLAGIVLLSFFVSGCQAQPEESPAVVVEELEMNDSEADATNDSAPVLNVVASFFPYADLLQQVGGDLVNVHQIVPDGVDPHGFELSPRELVRLESAHFILYNGLDMEIWMTGAIQQLDEFGVSMLKAGDTVELLSLIEESHGHAHDHDEDEHDHGVWDPHVWTDPVNMQLIGKQVAEKLKVLDPVHADEYQERYESYASALKEVDAAFRQVSEDADQKILLVSHAAFGYLAHRYDFQQIAVAGVVPHAEPNPGRLAELTKLAREKELDHIFFETLANPRTAEVLANEAGLKTYTLHNLEGITAEQRAAGETYLSLMWKNVATLEKALVHK